MRFIKRTAIALGVVCLLFSIVFAIVRKHRPLGKAPTIQFPSAVSQTTKIQLLKDDFNIISDVSALPPAVLETFRETGGSRLVLANRGAPSIPVMLFGTRACLRNA